MLSHEKWVEFNLLIYTCLKFKSVFEKWRFYFEFILSCLKIKDNANLIKNKNKYFIIKCLNNYLNKY